jgi:hypothetical protein
MSRPRTPPKSREPRAEPAASRAEPAACWQTAFVATAALLGEPPDAIADALGSSTERAKSLLVTLRSPSREIRARAIARGLFEAIVAVESWRLR